MRTQCHPQNASAARGREAACRSRAERTGRDSGNPGDLQRRRGAASGAAEARPGCGDAGQCRLPAGKASGRGGRAGECTGQKSRTSPRGGRKLLGSWERGNARGGGGGQGSAGGARAKGSAPQVPRLRPLARSWDMGTCQVQVAEFTKSSGIQGRLPPTGLRRAPATWKRRCASPRFVPQGGEGDALFKGEHCGSGKRDRWTQRDIRRARRHDLTRSCESGWVSATAGLGEKTCHVT